MRRPWLAPGLLLGTALDAVLADPAKGHPVAGFGTVASYLLLIGMLLVRPYGLFGRPPAVHL